MKYLPIGQPPTTQDNQLNTWLLLLWKVLQKNHLDLGSCLVRDADGKLYVKVDGTTIDCGDDGLEAIGGGGGGITDIADAGDVDFTGLADNDMMAYDSGTATWNDVTPDSTLSVDATAGTVGVNQSSLDHGSIGGLADDDHTQYHNDTRGDARYYTESEHISTSAGAGDAGKPIVLDAGGQVDATMVNSADIDHTQVQNRGTNSHATIDTHIADTSIHFAEGDIDHGAIGGLGDDDHTQYHNDTRGDIRYSRPWSGQFYNQQATAANARRTGTLNSAVTTIGDKIPTGYDLLITSCYYVITTGATAGTYTVRCGAYDRSGATFYTAATLTTTTTSTAFAVGTAGTVDSPLVTIPAGAEISIGWENDTTSPGALSNSAHMVHLCGVLVPT